MRQVKTNFDIHDYYYYIYIFITLKGSVREK